MSQAPVAYRAAENPKSEPTAESMADRLIRLRDKFRERRRAQPPPT